MSGDSDAAKDFEYNTRDLFLLFFLSREKTTVNTAHLALALSADGQRLVMVEFQRKAAGDHATGHRAWTQEQLLPSYWILELIYTVPTVRPPDSALPWRPLTHPRCVTLAPLSTVTNQWTSEMLMREYCSIQNSCYKKTILKTKVGEGKPLSYIHHSIVNHRCCAQGNTVLEYCCLDW